jgi:hypothetical protein
MAKINQRTVQPCRKCGFGKPGANISRNIKRGNRVIILTLGAIW